jgi:pyruvate ferredoxin oxidoreductase beta subunit
LLFWFLIKHKIRYDNHAYSRKKFKKPLRRSSLMKGKEEAMQGNNLISPGHSMCPGCGIAIAMNLISKAAPKNLIVSCATGCLEVTTTLYPRTAWNVPWIHCACRLGH